MKIGFDAKRAFLNRTGLGNYSRGVIDMVSSHESTESALLYTPKVSDALISHRLIQRKNVEVRTPSSLLKGPLSSVWRSHFISNQLKADGIDLFHGLSNELPFSIRQVGIPSVVTIHDLIFLHFPAYYKAIDRKIYTKKVKFACSVATRIIATSKQTAEDLVDTLGAEKSKISVVYQGCNNQFSIHSSKDELSTIKVKFNLPDRFILSVGTIEPRKNVVALVSAMASIEEKDVRLVLVGRKTDYANKVLREAEYLGLADRVVILDNVDSSDLPSIYQLASIFALPSLMEGFGIPVLEAMTSGVPVIVTEKSCLSEVAGNAGISFDPRDPSEIADALNSILNDENRRLEMITAGTERVKRFSDKRIRQDVLDVYRLACTEYLP